MHQKLVLHGSCSSHLEIVPGNRRHSTIVSLDSVRPFVPKSGMCSKCNVSHQERNFATSSGMRLSGNTLIPLADEFNWRKWRFIDLLGISKSSQGENEVSIVVLRLGLVARTANKQEHPTPAFLIHRNPRPDCTGPEALKRLSPMFPSSDWSRYLMR